MSQPGVPIPFTITVGALPPLFDGPPQALLNQLEEILQISLNEGVAFFTIGGAAPTSNIGPWFNTSTNPGTWYAWSNSLGEYIPLNVPQSSLGYIITSTAPDHTVYQIWFQTDSGGNPTAINAWNGTAWAPFGTLTPLMTAQIGALFGGVNTAVTPNQMNVNWAQLTGLPATLGGLVVAGYVGSTAQMNALTPNPYTPFFNTDINALCRYYNGGWHTEDGVPGDVKFVSANTLAQALLNNPGWVQDISAVDRVLIAADGSTYNNGSTGGATTVTLAQNQIPANMTGIALRGDTAGGGGAGLYGNIGAGSVLTTMADMSIINAGGGQPINILPPYIARWLLIKQ